MRHLSRYHTLHVVVRGMRIWPPNAAKCCKNAGKFFPDGVLGYKNAVVGLKLLEAKAYKEVINNFILYIR
jgi:hypothetical protein